MAVRTGGLTVLRPLGTGISDWTDLLIDPLVTASAVAALTSALLDEPGWDALDFPEVAPSAAVWPLFDGWPARRTALPASPCQEIVAGPLDDLVASLSRTNRSNVRRGLRKIDAAVERLLEMHLRQWQQRGAVTPEHKRPRFTRHLIGAATSMVPRDQAALCEYRLDGVLVASSLFVIGHDTVGGYFYGVDPELYQHFNVTTMMMRTAMDLAVRHDCSAFSLMRGREPYKSEWRPVSTRNSHLILGRTGSARGLVYARAVQGRELAVEAVRAHAPRLGSTVRRIHHSLRNPRPAVRAVGSAVRRGVGRRRQP
jgi:CelD/BcsL family acetyltransferase involved in cellulose biosynthesis